MVAAVEAVVVLLAVTSVVAEAAAVETVGNRINYLIEKGNQWFPFSVEGTEVAKRDEGVEVACGLLKRFKDLTSTPSTPSTPSTFVPNPNSFLQLCTTNPHMSIVNEFNEYRERMNDVILSKGNLVMKRLWNLDTNTYQEGVLDVKTKEMLGLVASMVLRCDDCIKYHLGKCHELGLTTDEVYEIFSVANIVGGTIVIPHTRRGAEYWEALQSSSETK